MSGSGWFCVEDCAAAGFSRTPAAGAVAPAAGGQGSPTVAPVVLMLTTEALPSESSAQTEVLVARSVEEHILQHAAGEELAKRHERPAALFDLVI